MVVAYEIETAVFGEIGAGPNLLSKEQAATVKERARGDRL
jgi:hypothetical protein